MIVREDLVTMTSVALTKRAVVAMALSLGGVPSHKVQLLTIVS